MKLPEELVKTLDLIKILTQKSDSDLVEFPVLLAAWNRAHPRASITLPRLLIRVKRLQSMGLIEIVKSRAPLSILGTAHLGQVDIRKSSIRLLYLED